MKLQRDSPFIILILGALMTVSPFSIDMYLPAFSIMAKEFDTTVAKISLSVSSYFLGLAIGQMLYGPLLDRFGRKKPLYYGLAFYILACVGCALSNSTETLVAFRFVQALGGCVAQVAAITMVRDFFPENRSAKVFSLLILILGVSPLLAPTIGGFVVSTMGWRWVFILLAIIIALIVLALFLWMPEGREPDKTVSLRAKPMLATFGGILKTPVFYTYALAGAFSFATLFIYVAGSPLIFMERYQVSPQAYGGIFAMLSVGFVGGSQLNILLLRRFTSRQLFSFALTCQVITGIVFLVGTIYGSYGLIATIILFFISLSCLGITSPNGSALALAPFSKNAGSASALMGFLQIGVAGIASACIGLLDSGSSVPPIAILSATSVLALVILSMGNRKIASYEASRIPNL